MVVRWGWSWCPASSFRQFGAAGEPPPLCNSVLSHPAVPGLPLRRLQHAWSEGHSSSSPPVLLASPTAFMLGWLCQPQRLPETKWLGHNVVCGVEQHAVPATGVPWWVKIAAALGLSEGGWCWEPGPPSHRPSQFMEVPGEPVWERESASVEKPCLGRELLARLESTGQGVKYIGRYRCRHPKSQLALQKECCCSDLQFTSKTLLWPGFYFSFLLVAERASFCHVNVLH